MVRAKDLRDLTLTLIEAGTTEHWTSLCVGLKGTVVILPQCVQATSVSIKLWFPLEADLHCLQRFGSFWKLLLR